MVDEKALAAAIEHCDALTADDCRGVVAAYLAAQPVPSLCQSCNGNDYDIPCAYPSGGMPGCYRDHRLKLEALREAARPAPSQDRLEALATEALTALPQLDGWQGASVEPLDIIEINECSYDPFSLATKRFRALFNEIKRLRKCHRENAWQPIDTAPKDGTTVLLWGSDSDVSPEPYVRTSYWREGFWRGVGFNYSGNATHWMPLPARPQPIKLRWRAHEIEA